MPCSLAVQTLTDASHQLTFTEVKATVFRIDNQDVLVTPALFLDRVEVGDLGLQATKRAAIGLWWYLHVTTTTQ